MDPRARWRRAGDLCVRSEATGGDRALESCRSDAHFVQRQKPAAMVRLSREQGGRVSQQARALTARAFVLLRKGLRRQSDRADGPGTHVLRAWLARSARRISLPPWAVQAVLRGIRNQESGIRTWRSGGTKQEIADRWLDSGAIDDSSNA